MALSGSFSAGYYDGDIRLGVTWSAAQSIANNTSVITASMYIQNNSGSDLVVAGNSATITFTINGTNYTASLPSSNTTISNGSKKTFATVTSKAVAHNSDGTKSVAVKANISTLYVQINGTWPSATNNAYVSGTAILDTISRATQPTVSSSNVNMGSAVIISTPRATSSFTHTLTYKFGSTSGTIASGVGTSYSWTVPLSLASQIPNALSGTCTITCATYNGSTLIGSKTVTITLLVPSSVVPSISAVSTSDPTGYLTTYGGYVQSKSTCKITATASGSYSSTIKSYRITANGASYSSNGCTTGALQTSGTNTITVTVTDSRGRTATKTTTIEVLAYAAPLISSVTAFRCTANGTEDDTGAYIKVNVEADITSLNSKNAKTFKLEYKITSSETWTLYTTWTSAYSLSTNVIIPVSTDYMYEVRLSATDSFGTSTYTVNISTAFTLIDFNESGKGLSFGKVSTEEGFDCNMEAIFRKGVKTDKGSDLDEAFSTFGLTREQVSVSLAANSTVNAYTYTATERKLVTLSGWCQFGSAGSGSYFLQLNWMNKEGTWQTIQQCNQFGSANNISYNLTMLLEAGEGLRISIMSSTTNSATLYISKNV